MSVLLKVVKIGLSKSSIACRERGTCPNADMPPDRANGNVAEDMIVYDLYCPCCGELQGRWRSFLFCFFLLPYILRRTSHPFSFPLFTLYSFPPLGWSVAIFEHSDMPGFLRRKTSPSKTVDTETPSKKSSSSDAPPSLPPLFPSRTSHTSSFRKEPESDMAPVLSPSQPAPPKENGAAGDSVLLPDITPLHSSLDVDTDWQDLLRFIDSPSLLGDSSSQETKPSTASEKHKRSSTPGGSFFMTRPVIVYADMEQG
ncbi:hypothetical protein EDD15DRAFT_2253702 [Pisolithus albus]|nr:hypothetical protein EDD15DRAFT_2253702 [Pisolithus albus]